MAASDGDSAVISAGSGGAAEALGSGECAAASPPLEAELSSLKLSDSAESPDSDSGGGPAAAAAAVRYPNRAGEPDCTYYLKFGVCRFGMKCKFNHPSRRKNGKEQEKANVKSGEASASLVDGIGEEAGTESEKQTKSEHATKVTGKDFFPETTVQTQCKYFSTPGGCRFGKACKFIHPDENTGKEDNPVEFNFLGLPLRPGEKECPFYMRTGSCKYSNKCKFHHPDPTAVSSRDLKQENLSGGAPQNVIQSNPSVPSQVHVSVWPGQRMLNEHVPFVSGLMPPEGMYPNPGWNGYQFPVNQYYAPHSHMQYFPPPPINAASFAPDISGGHQEHPNSYPERPGEPECQHYMRNGSCKFKTRCKYHHPKGRPSAPSANLSPIGLPINPDQPICTFYDRYGVCKFGPACVFNHPFRYNSPVPPMAMAPSHFPSPASNAV